MLNYKIRPYLFFGETGGTKRDVLLKDFVCRCYSPNDDFAKNKVLPSHVYNNCFNQVDTPNPSRSSCHAMSGQVAGTHHSEEQCQILATKLARLFMAYRGRDEVEAGLGRAPCLPWLSIFGHWTNHYPSGFSHKTVSRMPTWYPGQRWKVLWNTALSGRWQRLIACTCIILMSIFTCAFLDLKHDLGIFWWCHTLYPLIP